MTASEPAEESPRLADLWKAYELAQQHYDADLQLFSSRINLFLLVQSALVAFAAGSRQTVIDRHYLAVFGISLCAGWFLVAVSSYQWIKTWRAHMVGLGQQIKDSGSVTPSSLLFDRSHRRSAVAPAARLPRGLEWFSWHIRPTLITCCLPVLFLAGWIYLGWTA
ncbi:RipA family octameric membrane protein [Streptomyces phaeofaciens]|uniref:RipA family octameric membrane protein n=1 Tax=Streptomyces phaeofaciens TaxID=68254 RepID=UPI0036AFD321